MGTYTNSIDAQQYDRVKCIINNARKKHLCSTTNGQAFAIQFEWHMYRQQNTLFTHNHKPHEEKAFLYNSRKSGIWLRIKLA